MCRLLFIGKPALPTTEVADTAVLSCELSDIILTTKTHITPKSCDRPIDAIDSEAIGSVDHQDLAQFTPEVILINSQG
ncbi:hypothetical protein M0804_009911 [Polistes exclamans]|nr:hypothetical protein M0804_009911 [Polistes exclamans]